MVTIEQATVYRGGGRRWFSLNAACRAEAKAIMKRKCECDYVDHENYRRQELPCSLHHPDRYSKIVRRLARLVKASYK